MTIDVEAVAKRLVELRDDCVLKQLSGSSGKATSCQAWWAMMGWQAKGYPGFRARLIVGSNKPRFRISCRVIN